MKDSWIRCKHYRPLAVCQQHAARCYIEQTPCMRHIEGTDGACLSEQLAGQGKDDWDAAQGGGVRQALHDLVGTAVDCHLYSKQESGHEGDVHMNTEWQ